MKKILFYGDSNTYGYDPADFFGGSYSPEKIWTSILAEKLKGQFEIIGCGENGRRIPNIAGGYEYPKVLLSKLKEDDIFAIMLGANDLLVATSPKAELPIEKMEQFIAWLLARREHPRIFLIAPPLIGNGQSADPYIQKAYKESVRMNEGYERLAKKYNLLFADAGSWGLKFAFDEVHLSEEGHRIFAEQMEKWIRKNVNES